MTTPIVIMMMMMIPIDVTLVGILTDVREEQDANAEIPDDSIDVIIDVRILSDDDHDDDDDDDDDTNGCNTRGNTNRCQRRAGCKCRGT